MVKVYYDAYGAFTIETDDALAVEVKTWESCTTEAVLKLRRAQAKDLYEQLKKLMEVSEDAKI